MVLMVSRNVLCLFFAGMVSLASGAAMDTITGVCSDSINGMLIDSVTVSGDGASALSDSKGVFTIVVPQTGTNGFVTPQTIPSLTWHAEKGAFSWPGCAGVVSITVHSIQGTVVARAVSGKNLNGNTFSLSRLPQGMYLVSIETGGIKSVYKVSCIRTRGLHSFSLLTRNNGPVSKTTATVTPHTLTFIKNNFDTLKRAIPAGTTTSVAARMYSKYPLKNILKLFLDPTIPETGPKEHSPLTCISTAVEPPDLVGGQLKKHDFVLIGEDCRRICVVINGRLVWNYDTEDSYEDDDIWVLSNGNVLHAHMGYLEEITPKKDVVFRYPETGGAPGEIHTCMPIGLDSVLFVLNHDPSSDVCIYSIKEQKIVFQKNIPELSGGTHIQCRRVRGTDKGTYVFGAFATGKMREYDKDFKLLLTVDAGSFWSGIPLKNGNFLVQREAAATAVEYNRDGEIVWSCSAADIKKQTDSIAPGTPMLASTQTNLRLTNGNTIILTRGKALNYPQAVEVTPDKKVVWILQDWRDLVQSVAMFMLDEPGYPEIPGQMYH